MMRSAGSITARASSGSRSSINSVEPLMSANNAVIVLRSPSGSSVSDTDSGAITAGGTSIVTSKAAPQSPQKRLASEFSAPHFVQRIYIPFRLRGWFGERKGLGFELVVFGVPRASDVDLSRRA